MSKIILITGASTGIGAETAVHLGNGNTIIVHYNSSQQQAAEVAEKVRNSGGDAHLVQADLATNDGCQTLFDYVAPGVIETPFHDKVTSPDRMNEWKQVTPLKRHGRALHIAMAIKLLIENDFMTGETIDVNGGLFMR